MPGSCGHLLVAPACSRRSNLLQNIPPTFVRYGFANPSRSHTYPVEGHRIQRKLVGLSVETLTIPLPPVKDVALTKRPLGSFLAPTVVSVHNALDVWLIVKEGSSLVESVLAGDICDLKVDVRLEGPEILSVYPELLRATGISGLAAGMNSIFGFA